MFGSLDRNSVLAVGFSTDSLAVLNPSIPSWQVSIRSSSTETTSSFFSGMCVLRGQVNSVGGAMLADDAVRPLVNSLSYGCTLHAPSPSLHSMPLLSSPLHEIPYRVHSPQAPRSL